MTNNNLTKRKNYLMLALLLGWVVAVFAITIVKIRENGYHAVPAVAESESHSQPGQSVPEPDAPQPAVQ